MNLNQKTYIELQKYAQQQKLDALVMVPISVVVLFDAAQRSSCTDH